MSLYGYPREPEPSDEDTFGPPTAPPEPFTQPPAPLLPPDPPGFTTMGAHGLADGDAPVPNLSGRIPGQRRDRQEQPAPPPGPAEPPDSGGWRHLLPTSPPAAPEPSLPPPVDAFVSHEAPAEPSSFGISGRHRVPGTAEEPPAPEPPPGEKPFRWLGDDPDPTPAPGFGPSPSMGQPVLERPGFGASPSMGQPAVPFGQPAPSGPAPSLPPPSLPPLSHPPPSGPTPHLAAQAMAAQAVPAPPRPAPAPSLRAPSGRSEPPTVPPPAAAERPAAPAGPTLASPGMPSDADIAALLDEPEVVPWDNRPLLVVIATAIVLALIGVLSGFVATRMVDPPSVSWRDSPPSAGLNEQPTPAP